MEAIPNIFREKFWLDGIDDLKNIFKKFTLNRNYLFRPLLSFISGKYNLRSGSLTTSLIKFVTESSVSRGTEIILT